MFYQNYTSTPNLIPLPDIFNSYLINTLAIALQKSVNAYAISIVENSYSQLNQPQTSQTSSQTFIKAAVRPTSPIKSESTQKSKQRAIQPTEKTILKTTIIHNLQPKKQRKSSKKQESPINWKQTATIPQLTLSSLERQQKTTCLLTRQVDSWLSDRPHRGIPRRIYNKL